MAKLSIDDLKKIKENTAKEISVRSGPSKVKITVHMGTCGIAAGARDVMSSLMELVAESGRDDIRVVNSGCMGMCSSEPNVTVEIKDEEPIVYKLVDKNKMRQIFKQHVMKGEVQTDFALGKI
jgi:NADP-reducing hydrogenase subunit HndB